MDLELWQGRRGCFPPIDNVPSLLQLRQAESSRLDFVKFNSLLNIT